MLAKIYVLKAVHWIIVPSTKFAKIRESAKIHPTALEMTIFYV